MEAKNLMNTAAESGGLSKGLSGDPADADRKLDVNVSGGSAVFAGTQLNHEQISAAMYGEAPFVGLPANLNPWPDVYFVSNLDARGPFF